MSESNLIYVRCAVSCVNSNGEADFYFCKVVCTTEQYDLGDHYNFAKEAAENEGYETHLAYDEVECPALMSLCVWSTVDYIGLIGKPVTDRPTGRPPGVSGELAHLERNREENMWGEHPRCPRKDWRDEIDNEDTNLGYWDWAQHRLEALGLL